MFLVQLGDPERHTAAPVPPLPGQSPLLGPQNQAQGQASLPWKPVSVIADHGQYVVQTELPRLIRERHLTLQLRSELVLASRGLCATKTTFGNYFNHASAHDCMYLIRVSLSWLPPSLLQKLIYDARLSRCC